ncbi:MAG: DUF4331 domain-containing protein, partial [Deltaproteobacteria bacterium]|nr:DUF4331 domain-containing protein [Deltaproteobacteria bacterium]
MRKGVIEYGAEKNWVIASLVWGVCVFTLFPACGGGDNQGSQDAFIPRDAFRPDAPDSFVVADGGAMDSPGPSPSDAGSDAAMPMDAGSDGGPFMPSNDCMGYCRLVTMNCSGDNSQYIDMSDCMAKCAALGWPPGTPGENTGNTIACRITHAMMASGGSAEEACRRAGPTGGGVCGAPIAFDMRPSEMATRVDRMGMPAVATASIPRGRRNEYNDANPADDLMLRFANDQAMAIAQLHMLLDDDLMAMGLMPCSMT